ncbi:Tetraspanin/Peripherin [Trinorchestia longiramus]|nr:Tetraspanin/Peripherin [Trinorchestia longiramus]
MRNYTRHSLLPTSRHPYLNPHQEQHQQEQHEQYDYPIFGYQEPQASAPDQGGSSDTTASAKQVDSSHSVSALRPPKRRPQTKKQQRRRKKKIVYVMASLSCGAIFVKYILCLFNFTFFAVGGIILALSVWLAVDNTSFLLITRLSDNPTLQVYNTPSVLEQGAYVLIVASALIFLLGFLGCCGAAMESKSLLTTYGLLIIVMFVLQVTGGVLAAVYKTQAEDELEELLKYSLQKYYSTPQRANAVTLAWDAVMEELECCGVNNYTDFEKAALWQTNKTDQQVVPIACCNMALLPELQGDDPFSIGHDFNDNIVDPGGTLQTFQEDSGQLLLLQQDEPVALEQRQRNRQKNRQQQFNRRQQQASSCTTNPNPTNSYYLTGCYGRLKLWVRRNSGILLYAVIALGIAELLAILLAFSLCSAVGESTK